MAFVVLDEEGNEYIGQHHPVLEEDGYWYGYYDYDCRMKAVKVPEGTIEKLLGYELEQVNKPIELC